MFQLVGAECSVCAEKIKREAGASGCLACEATFHEKCTRAAGECPGCGEDYQALWREAERDHAAAQRRAERHNKKLERRRRMGGGMFVTGAMGFLWTITRRMDIAPELKLALLFLWAIIVVAGVALMFFGRSRA